MLMQFTMYAIIFASSLSSFLSSPEVRLLPAPLKYLPEILSALVAVYVVVAGIRQRFRYVNAKYLLIFGALAILMLCSAVSNSVGPGPIISGMRYYLRPLPMFFLPAVFNFEEWQLRRWIRCIFAICLLQIPIALYQRHAIMATGHTSNADAVYGTMMHSGVLSLFLICAVCILSAAMLRGRVSRWTFAVLFLLFVIPMSINETKVTVFLLPLGLLTTFIVGAPPNRRLRTALSAIALLLAGTAIFVPVFNYYQAKSVVPYKIGDFLTKKGELEGYLDQDARVGSNKEAGRIDALTIPLQQLAHDPVTLAFGLGIGNASRSSLGSNFVGSYFGKYGRYTNETSAAAFLLETGVLGLMMILLLHWLILRDAIFVARHDDGLIGALALGGIASVIVVTAGIFYITIHVFESLSYMFWLFSGLIAAARQRMSVAIVAAPTPPQTVAVLAGRATR